MKITKLVHSCLLVELDGKKILVDPGAYSWKDEIVKDFDFSNITAVVITHNHPDHFNDDFVRTVKDSSPSAAWHGTPEVVDELNELGIDGNSSSEDPDIRFVESQHADLSPWFDTQPEHTSYVLFEKVLISGDCQTLASAQGVPCLSGAINGGPWGAVVGFAKMIESMKERPKVVLPLHDWHWNEDARNTIYAQLAIVMDKFGVKFIALKNYVEQEISL